MRFSGAESRVASGPAEARFVVSSLTSMVMDKTSSGGVRVGYNQYIEGYNQLYREWGR
jgi:hypothetical protein